MRCARCLAENPADTNFCGQCAAPLTVSCTFCGASNPHQNRFCGRCAAALEGSTPAFVAGFETPERPASQIDAARGALSGERKQVTALFCDIVDSTAITDRLGAEAMHELVSAFIDISLAEVHRLDGIAPQFSGDGFMALFGAPVTHEDHVRRALLAALAIQRALGEAGDRDEVVGLKLQIRIGIHTGPVVFGAIGGNFRVDTAIGDPANLAARLQQAAAPGEILVSGAVQALAQGYARVEPLGLMTFKGKPDPIPAFRLLSVSRGRAARDAVTPARMSNFVGRADELALLYDVLRRVEDGHGQVIGIVGEPGIGKSRLVAEFRRHSTDGQIVWVEGQCLSYGSAIPYLLALDVLRSHCGIVETDSAEAIVDKVHSGLCKVGMDPDQDGPVLLHLLGIKDVSRLPALSNPEAVKTKSFEVLRRLCIEGCRRRTLVLVLEDLHWIDAVSEELLALLAENVVDSRMLVLATHRPEYRPPWHDKSPQTQIQLQPLSWDDSLQIVRSVLQQESLADPLAEEMVAKADGNPLFLEQLALHAGEISDHRSDLMVPQTIHGVVMARIDRLPATTKQLLQNAAVIGREFSLRLLRAVWQGDGSLDIQLRELSRLEFIYERVEPEGSLFVFRHWLTQEAAYGSLLERHRTAYHADIGRALEMLYEGRTAEVAELLAFHFGRSDQAEKAVDYGILAAEKAQSRWANSDALAYFTDALRRLDALSDTAPNRLRRIDAVLKQAEVKFALGQHTEHIRSLEEIRDIVEHIDDPGRRATWHYWTGFLHSLTGGLADVAIAHCREAASIASAAGLDDVDGFAMSCLAQAYIVAGRLRDAIEAGEHALSNFESRGNLWWAGRTLWFLSIAANCLGEWRASLDYCKRGLEYGTTLGDLRLKTVGWLRSGVAYIAQGDLEQGLRCCNKALTLASTPYDVVWARAVRGYAEIKSGRVDSGIAELSDAFAWFETSHLRYTHLYFAAWLAEGHLRRGDRECARPLIEDVLATCRAAGYRHYEGRACWLMAECLAAEAPAAAEDFIDNALRILEQVGAQNDLAKAMVTRAILRRNAGDVATARKLLDRACAIFQNLGTRDEPARAMEILASLDREPSTRMVSSIGPC